MTTKECAEILAYLEAGIQRPLSKHAARVYCDLLADLPVEALRVAAKTVLLNHAWATFPSIAELRQAATDAMKGRDATLTSAEAWALAWKVAGKIDVEIDGSAERRLAEAKLPAIVEDAMRKFGLAALCAGREPVAVVRAQFTKMFDQLRETEGQKAMLPGSVRKAIEGVSARQIAHVVKQIGVEK